MAFYIDSAHRPSEEQPIYVVTAAGCLEDVLDGYEVCSACEDIIDQEYKFTGVAIIGNARERFLDDRWIPWPTCVSSNP